MPISSANTQPRIYVSAGEISGELHAARLIQEFGRLAPGCACTAMGGDILRLAGAEVVIDAANLRVMGFAEILAHMTAFHDAFRRALDHVLSVRPDAVVLVDYPGFHLRLARAIRKRAPDIRIFYYIAPKAWAWNERRVRSLRDCVTRVLCILPFEEDWFRQREVPAVYVGNPSLDRIRELPAREVTRRDLGAPDASRVVSIFPGSRIKEIERMLPVLFAAAADLGRRFGQADWRGGDGPSGALAFALAVAPGIRVGDLERIAVLPPWVRVVEGDSLRLLAASDFVLAKSGTTTLEAALLGVPMVVFYQAHWLSAWIGRRCVNIPWFSLPNIVAGRKIVSELFQEQATAQRIADEAAMILADPLRLTAMRRDLDVLRSGFGNRPAATTAAQEILAEIA